MIYGIENEPVAANLYKSYLLSLPAVKEVTVQVVGLILHKDDTVLGASLTELQPLSTIMAMLR